MSALIALGPIVLILALMVGRRWSAASAGTLGLIAAIVAAVSVFGLGSTVLPELTPIGAIAGVLVEATFIACTVLWIVFPALCILEMQGRSGAFDVLKDWLANISGDPRIAAILVGWFFALFMEGAAGFGTPVALAAPLLVALGFAPLQALSLVLIGHAAGVSFGAVGTPVFPQAAVTGLAAIDISRQTAVMHAALGTILLVFLFRIAGGVDGATGWGGVRQWSWVGAAAACFLVPFLVIATFVGPELPTLAGALIGGALFVALLRWRRAPTGVAGSGGAVSVGRIGLAALPYLVLLALILVTRLIPALRGLLQEIAWEWSLAGSFSGSVQPLYHPGTMLFGGFLFGGLLQGRGMGEIGVAMRDASRRILPVVVALVAMLGLSRVMVHAEMIAALADAAAALFGPVWPLVVPSVGVLGSFVTGSATASNILLTSFQEATGLALGLPVLPLVAAQGFGAAVGNIVCPHNIIAGAATVGLQGQEGAVLRRTALACACYATAGGIFLIGFIWYVTDQQVPGG